MKTDRQLGIIAILQQRGKVTAPYLAERFEVSRRTINRDIEDICRAGIPLVTTQGANGGISLMEGFALDTTVFTEQELAAIFAGLRSLDSVGAAAGVRQLPHKLGGDRATGVCASLDIDLASFYRDDLALKIETIRQAIRSARCIGFHYCYPKGEADKYIEPCQVLFKWSDWYVFGFCRERQDFRMYKLRRLWDLRVSQEAFTPRDVPEAKRQFGAHLTDDYIVCALYDPAVKYRLVEEYGRHSFTQREDGLLYAERGFSSRSSALAYFLSFGTQVRVLDPPEMVELMRSTAEGIRALHET